MLIVDRLKDLRFKLDVSVVVLRSGTADLLKINFASAVDSDDEDACLAANELKVRGNAAQEHKAAAKVTNMSLDYLNVCFDQHHSTLEVLTTSLECQLDTSKLLSIVCSCFL